jgi:hypothetical protein
MKQRRENVGDEIVRINEQGADIARMRRQEKESTSS